MRAIKLIEKRRDDYIREHCQSFNDGHWVGTNAQQEYVSELNDIIELLCREQEGHADSSPERNREHLESSQPPARKGEE